MKLDIIHYPDDRLRRKAKFVDVFDSSLEQLTLNMLETMYHADGIGLAAIQIGIELAVMVVDITEDKSQPYTFINAKILHFSAEKNTYKEGCLSVPDTSENVVRPANIEIAYQDIHGKHYTLKADGLLATCIQHELDHLDGKVFIDRISGLKKSLIDARIKKAKG
jgi:peptide deformylase